MAFTLPTFNLTCNIFTYDGTDITLRLDSPCNLAYGKRTLVPATTSNPDENSSALTQMELLLPAGTDIRDASCDGWPDVVECPAGSGRFYFAFGVDDAGKGFDNEHRVANLWKTWKIGSGAWPTQGPWPTPIP